METSDAGSEEDRHHLYVRPRACVGLSSFDQHSLLKTVKPAHRLRGSDKRDVRGKHRLTLNSRICVINIVRMGFLATSDRHDFTYGLTNVFTFSGLEIWFGLIAACLPTLKPIYTQFRAGPTNSPTTDYQDRNYKRTHSKLLNSTEFGQGIELDVEVTSGQRTCSSEPHLPTPDDDNLPLR